MKYVVIIARYSINQHKDSVPETKTTNNDLNIMPPGDNPSNLTL
jgi:hypothetical protein